MSARRVIALFAATASLVAGGLAVVPTASAIGSATSRDSADVAASDVDTSAVEQFGACLAGGAAGDLLLLVDASSSIKSTDPRDGRVIAATYLADALASFADEAGASVDLKVATFAADYKAPGDWVALSPANRNAITSQINGLRNANSGIETDYWTALEGARRDLADKQASAGGERCQAIAWFSDGRLRIQARTGTFAEVDGTKGFSPDEPVAGKASTARFEKMAESALCEPTGLADQLRSSGVLTFGIGLSASGDGDDFALMRRIATGTDDAGAECGGILEPRPGDFALATDIDDMLFAFDRLSTPGSDPITLEGGICQSGPCASGTHSFVLDKSIAAVDILASADLDSVEVFVQPPTGKPALLEPSEVGVTETMETPNGNRIDFRWETERTVSISLDRDAGGPWAGQWGITFVDPEADARSTSRSNIHITTDLVPEWVDQPATLRVGDVIEKATFAVLDGSGEEFDARSLRGTALLDVALVYPDGTRVPLLTAVPAKRIALPKEIDLTGAPAGRAALSMSLAITTAPAKTPSGQVPGTALSPSTVDQAVTVLPPAEFPAAISTLDFGTLDNTTTASGRISLAGDGCVWIEAEPTLTAIPEGVGEVRLSTSATSAASCHSVAGDSDLTVDLELASPGSGALAGAVTVMLAPRDDLDRAVAVQVPLSADVRKPLRGVVFWVVLLVAVLLGVLVPIALLYGTKWFVARIPRRGLYWDRIRVTVTEHSVRRGGGPLRLAADDFREFVGMSAAQQRRLRLGAVTLRSHLGISPVGSGYVTLELEGAVSASDAMPPTVRGPRARWPLAVHNRWAVLREPSMPSGEYDVFVIVSGDASRSRREEIFADAADRLPELVRLLGGPAPGGDTPGDSPDEWGATAQTDSAGEWGSGGSGSTDVNTHPSGGWGAGSDETAPEAGGSGGWSISDPGWGDSDRS